jgi:DNA-binding NarL/FixJ family response regulator
MATRVLIADDDAAIRRLLRRLIESRFGWTVCAEARDGHDAVSKISQFKPDIAVIDLAMPDMNGLQAGKEVAETNPSLPMLLLTVQQVSKQLTREAQSNGFRGALSKNNGTEVVRAIEVLLNNQEFFPRIPSDALVW